MLFSANLALTAIAVIGFSAVHAAPVPTLLGSVHPLPRDLKGFSALISSRSELLVSSIYFQYRNIPQTAPGTSQLPTSPSYLQAGG
jgi:hypothetical protein